MEKGQVKARRDKKKNTETGLLMGQNTNIFSQLSATYMQKKGSVTEDESQFINSTKIIECHDQNINRIISLLRKKAEVTKVKAVQELREEVAKMNAEQLEDLMPTFSQLYLQSILNQPSKQVIDEFVSILGSMLTFHKKIVTKEISTLYPPMLISFKLSKLAELLFTGTPADQAHKALLLLLKKQSRKKFVTMFKIVMECEEMEKVAQTHFQRNAAALMKVVKEFIKVFNKSDRKEDEEFQDLLDQLTESLQSRTVEEFFKNGGKAKAAILDLETVYLNTAALHPNWKIEWKSFAKIIGKNFLDKDPVVQQTLWKLCNSSFLKSLLLLETQGDNYLQLFLPKPEQALLSALKVGGLQMYKQLPEYCQIFPSTRISKLESHKTIVPKINYIRKLMSSILDQDDENEARIECYYLLSKAFIEQLRGLQLQEEEEKKVKEVKSLAAKLEKEVMEMLQEKYYGSGLISKNNLNYYLPAYFCKLINDLDPLFKPRFDPLLSFDLFKQLSANSKHLQWLLDNSRENSKLVLKYLESYPSVAVEVDMTENNPQVQLASKIYLLSKHEQHQQWFAPNWDINKKIIVYDPRITVKDLEAWEEEGEDVTFQPIYGHLSSTYCKQELDQTKFEYFLQQLNNPQSLELKYMVSYLNDYLLPRNPHHVNSLLKIYQQKAELLKANQWAVAQHQVAVISIISDLVVELLKKKNVEDSALLSNFIEYYCEFARVIHGYKMEDKAQELLKKLSGLALIPSFRELLNSSASKSIRNCYNQLLKTDLDAVKDKIRKNRLTRCTSFIAKVMWYCLERNSDEVILKLGEELFCDRDLWNRAESSGQTWEIGFTLMGKNTNKKVVQKISQLIIEKKYKWVLSLILCSQVVLPLQSHPQSKRFYLSLSQQILTSILHKPQKQCLFILEELLDYTFESKQTIQGEGLKVAVSYLLSAKEGKGQQKQAYQLFGDMIHYSYEKHIKQQPGISQINLFMGLLGSLPLSQIEGVEKLYLQLYSQLENIKGLAYVEILATCAVFWSKSIGIGQLNELQVNSLLSRLFAQTSKTKQQSSIVSNFLVYASFSVVSSIEDARGPESCKEHWKILKELFWQSLKQGTELHGLAQCAKMGYATKGINRFDKSDLLKFMVGIPRIAREEYLFYREVLSKIDEEGTEEDVYYQHVVSLFIEISEFLVRATGFLEENCQPDEHIILELIQCPFPALKKSSFLMLKQMYELKIVSPNPPQLFEQVLKFEVKPHQELSNVVCNEMSTFLYSWMALILRRNATERVVPSQEETLNLEEYIQAESFSDLFLKNCFTMFDDKLNYIKNETLYELAPNDLMETDYEINFLEEEDHYHLKMFKMTLRTLFMFVANFPVFLKDFMDRNKKYKNVCDKLLRNAISDAIFKQEIDKIELREHEWKAQGNFEIYVIHKNKEIYAEYNHEAIRIGLRIVMKSSYPLMPLSIEFGEGLKMEEGSRWMLMLQTQLHSRNNTIINGILLWKDNIDKKLAGVEECSICFDIVNNHGQLPKKACKTCKKKFHGNCIMKWFSKSNKSQCPLCKSQFL